MGNHVVVYTWYSNMYKCNVYIQTKSIDQYDTKIGIGIVNIWMDNIDTKSRVDNIDIRMGALTANVFVSVSYGSAGRKSRSGASFRGTSGEKRAELLSLRVH